MSRTDVSRDKGVSGDKVVSRDKDFDHGPVRSDRARGRWGGLGMSGGDVRREGGVSGDSVGGRVDVSAGGPVRSDGARGGGGGMVRGGLGWAPAGLVGVGLGGGLTAPRPTPTRPAGAQ